MRSTELIRYDMAGESRGTVLTMKMSHTPMTPTKRPQRHVIFVALERLESVLMILTSPLSTYSNLERQINMRDNRWGGSGR